MKKNLLIVALVFFALFCTFAADSKTEYFSSEEALSKLNNDYSISVRYSVSTVKGSDPSGFTEMTTIKNGGYTMFETEGTRLLMNNESMYGYDTGYDKYTSYINTKELTDQDFSQMVFSLGLIQESIEYDTKSSGTYLGRAVDIYKREVKEDSGFGSTFSSAVFYMDKKTGLCFKAESITETSVMGYNAYYKMVFEVTKFSDSGKADMQKELNKILATSWPTREQFTQMGLPNVSKMDFKAFTAEVYLDYDTQKPTEHKIMFRLNSKSDFDKICSSLYNIGFKKNSGGESVKLDELKYMDLSDSVYYYGSFEGYYDNEGKKGVRVDYSNSEYYEVEEKEVPIASITFFSYYW